MGEQTSDDELARALIDSDDDIFYPEGLRRCLFLRGTSGGTAAAEAIDEEDAPREVPPIETDPGVDPGDYRTEGGRICSTAVTRLALAEGRLQRALDAGSLAERAKATAEFLDRSAALAEREVASVTELSAPPRLLGDIEAYVRVEQQLAVNLANSSALYAAPAVVFDSDQARRLSAEFERLKDRREAAGDAIGFECAAIPPGSV